MELSVVIPVRDRVASLDLVLFWFGQVLPLRSEVIVVDDGSVENVSEVIEKYRHSLPLSFLRQAPSGPAAARNTGWHEATGKRILFVDADRIPAKSDLRPHVDADGVVLGPVMELFFARPQEHVEDIRGWTAAVASRAREAVYFKLIRQYLFDAAGKPRTGLPWMAFLSGNVSVPRLALEATGGFDEEFRSWGVEHFELGYRLCREGLSFHLASQSPNYHLAHERPKGFYEGNLAKSLDYFRAKHQDATRSIDALGDFLFGHATLQQVEMTAAAPGSWLQEFSSPVYFRGSTTVLANHAGE